MLAECRTLLASSHFAFRPQWVSIMDGRYEGLFAWAAANYVAGLLQVRGGWGGGGGGRVGGERGGGRGQACRLWWWWWPCLQGRHGQAAAVGGQGGRGGLAVCQGGGATAERPGLLHVVVGGGGAERPGVLLVGGAGGEAACRW